MRKRSPAKKPISVHAVAGTNVVLLGLNATPKAAKGLLGFKIKRSGGGADKWLSGGLTFPGQAGGAKANSNPALIQTFLWGDYQAKPGTTYTYAVTAAYGGPGKVTD